MAMITAKDIHIVIKNNHGTQFMMERYGFQNEEELFDSIRNIAPSGASEFISALKKNQKKLDKKSKRNIHNIHEEESDQAFDENEVETKEELDAQFSEESIPENDATDIKEEEEEESDPPEVQLEKLKKEEQELSVILCAYESEHKQMVAQRRDCVNRFTQAEKALTELNRLIEVQQKKVTTILAEYESLDIQMKTKSEEIAVGREWIESIRSQIAELNKVIIFVYQNGNIEVGGANIPYVAEDNINSEFTKLISLPDAEELTIKELKTVAKVRLVADAIKQEDHKVELVFDSLQVQKFYETVVA